MAASTVTVGPAIETASDRNPRRIVEEGKRATCVPEQWALDTGECHLPCAASFQGLISHIVQVHHRSLRRQLVAIWTLLDQLFIEVDQQHLTTLTLRHISKSFESVFDKLVDCMIREERGVFPQIEKLEYSAGQSSAARVLWGESLDEQIRALESSQFCCLLAVRNLNELTGEADPAIQQCAAYHKFVRAQSLFSSDVFEYLFEVNCLLLERVKAMGRERANDWKHDSSPNARDRIQDFADSLGDHQRS